MRTPEQIKEYQKQWREKNKQKRADYAKTYHAAWYEKNRDKKILQNKEWDRNNRDKRRNITKKYQQTNPEAGAKSTAKYKSFNPQKVKKSQYKHRKTSKGYYSSYKSGAIKRGHVFNLGLQEFVHLLANSCYYCGKAEAMGVDRLNNSVGYTKENSVSCCHFCNRMKWTHPESYFLEHITQIAKHRGIMYL